MLKVEINSENQIFVSGSKSDLSKLKNQIEEVIRSNTEFIQIYEDFKWDAWEKKESPATLSIKIDS